MDTKKRYRNKNPKNIGFLKEEYELLSVCLAFRTLEEQADIYIRQYGAKTPLDRVISRLNDFIRRGLLIEENEFRSSILKILPARPKKEEAGKIEVICIPTANRPSELERLMKSLVDHLAKYDRAPEIVVADDSDDGRTKENLAILEKNRLSYKGIITHLDKKAREKLAAEISKKCAAPLETLLFTLCGDESFPNRLGALRNSIILYSAGKKILMLDDDVVMNLHVRPDEKSSDICITSSYSNGHFYFKDFQSSASFFPEIETDYLSLHEQNLGKNVSEILYEYSEKLRFDGGPGGLTGSAFNSLYRCSEPESKVRLGYSGSIGASWSRFHSVFDTGGETAHGLFGSTETEYNMNTETPFVSRLVPPTLYYGSTCIGLNISIDVRDFVPPFPPLFRGSDNVFGLIMNKIYPTSFSFHIPVGVEHDRSGLRTRDHSPFAYHGTIASLTKTAISSFKPDDSLSPKDKVSSLGRYLVELGAMPVEGIEALVRQITLSTLPVIKSYSKLVSACYPQAPSWWTEDIDDYAKTGIDSINFFFDVPEWNKPGANAWKEFQMWLTKYGNTLIWWSEMFKVAQR